MPSDGGPNRPVRWIESQLGLDVGKLRGGVEARLTRLRRFLGDTHEPKAYDASSNASKWIRPKGNLTHGELVVLGAIALIPLLMIAVRISAWPGMLGPELSGTLIPDIGQNLNQFLSLHQIPANDRDRVFYLLFLPTGAMLIAFARLTLGLRVIGFRSILIALGFQASGVVPSLILIGVMVFIVVSIRPTLVRMRLAYYPRVSVVMTLSAIVMLATLLVAPWMRSETIWSLGFFPVIVLGLLAESIAKTLDKANTATAFWRTGMTIGIALLLAGVGQLPLLREVAIRFPELVFTQLAMIFFISEFLDLRLLQDLDTRLGGSEVAPLAADSQTVRIAVVRNNRRSGVIGRLGPKARGGYDRASVRAVVAALRRCGHSVKVVEGDMHLLSRLRDFIPPHPRSGEPGGIVMNLGLGIQGGHPAAHVPAMLEMAGLPYTGPTPHGHMVALDKVMTTTMLTMAGISTPDTFVLDRSCAVPEGLPYPLVVKPRHAARYRLRIARDRDELEVAARTIARREGQEAVAQPYVEGREIQVALIGNDPVECLPLVEAKPGTTERVCPAALDPAVAKRVEAAAVAAFRACGCRDYAVMNLRIPPAQPPQVIEIDETDTLAPDGPLALAAEAAGHDFQWVVERIVAVARERWREDGPSVVLQLASESTHEERGDGRQFHAG